MINNFPRYNRNEWKDRFEYMANKADKFGLCECPGVYVTQSEIEDIEKLESKILQKLYFTLLCLAKYTNFKIGEDYCWVNVKTSELYNLACINLPACEHDYKLNELYKLEYIDFPKRVDNLKIKTLKIDSERHDDDVLITDFRRLGNEWLILKDKGYIRCSTCGIPIKKTNNRKCYCKECGKVNKLFRNRLYRSGN